MHRRIIYTALAWAPLVAAVPTGGDADYAYATTSAQVHNKTVIFENEPSYAPRTPQANDQQAWHTPLSTPVRRRVSTNDFRATFPIQPEAKDQQAWHYPLTTPTRLARSTYAQQTFVYAYHPLDVAPQPGDANLAFATSSWQVASKTIVYEPDAYAPFTPAGEVITIDKWWRQLDLPVRRKFVTGEEGSHFGSPPKAEANDAVAWHDNLEIPTRAKRLPIGGYQFEARAAFPQVPWGWYEKLDEPFRLKKTPATQLSLTFVAAAPGAGTEYNWFIPIDWPTRARKLYEYPATAIPVYFVPPTPGSGFEYNWWSQLDEPIRPRKALRTGAQQALTAPSQLITTTLEYAWHQRLSEPVRLKAKRALYDDRAQPGQYQVEEVVTIDKWWRELARPTRLKVRINYPALTTANVNPVVPYARTWVDDPRRRLKRVDRLALAQGTVNQATVEVGKFIQWWRQLDLPVREWRRIAWQWFTASPPTGVVFINPDAVEGGPADEPERVICVLAASRVATEPLLLRDAVVPVTLRTATVPELARIVSVPLRPDAVDSNEYRDDACAPFGNEAGIPPVGGTGPTDEVVLLEDSTDLLLEDGESILLE